MPLDFSLTPEQMAQVGVDVNANLPAGAVPVAITGNVWSSADFDSMCHEANITFADEDARIGFYGRLQEALNSLEAKASITRRLRASIIETMETVREA